VRAQLIEKCEGRRLVSSHGRYHGDAIDTAGFLCVHAERAGKGGATGKTNEFAPPHVPPKIQRGHPTVANHKIKRGMIDLVPNERCRP
jgi:hypothetical protein